MGEELFKSPKEEFERIEKRNEPEVQNKADAPCWHRETLTMDWRLCTSPLFAGGVLPRLCPGLLLCKDWNASSSDSHRRIFKGSLLSLHIFASSPSHRQCHSAEADDCLKVLSAVVTGKDRTCCLWHQRIDSFARDNGTYFHSHTVGVSVLWWEQGASTSQEVHAGALKVCEKCMALPVEFITLTWRFLKLEHMMGLYPLS